MRPEDQPEITTEGFVHLVKEFQRLSQEHYRARSQFSTTTVLAALERGDWNLKEGGMHNPPPAEGLPGCSLTGLSARSITLIQLNSRWKTSICPFTQEKKKFLHSLLSLILY